MDEELLGCAADEAAYIAERDALVMNNLIEQVQQEQK